MLQFFAKRLNELQTVKRDERGFTLIELLVVVIIIGILAAIAIPAFLAQRDRARVATVESDIRNAAAAAVSCSAANDGSYGTACDSVAELEAFDFNTSEGVNWSTADFTATTNDTFVVSNVQHADNSSIVGSFSSADGRVVVTS